MNMGRRSTQEIVKPQSIKRFEKDLEKSSQKSNSRLAVVPPTNQRNVLRREFSTTVYNPRKVRVYMWKYVS